MSAICFLSWCHSVAVSPPWVRVLMTISGSRLQSPRSRLPGSRWSARHCRAPPVARWRHNLTSPEFPRVLPLETREGMAVRWWTPPRTLPPPTLRQCDTCYQCSDRGQFVRCDHGLRVTDAVLLRETLYAVCKEVSGTRPPSDPHYIDCKSSRCHQ